MGDGEIMAVGIIMAIFGLMGIVSAPFDSVVMAWIKISLDLLKVFSSLTLVAGIAVLIIGIKARQRSS